VLVKSLIGYKWLPFAVGAFAIASVYLAYRIDNKAYERGRSEVQAAWDAEKLVQLQEYASLQSRYNQVTAQLKQDAKALSEDLRSKLNETEQEYQAIVSDLRSGNLRLRQQWQSCSADLSGAASDPGAAGGNDGSSQAGVSPEAIERILRIGTEADQVAIRLQSCQEYVERITETFAGKSNK
jgi:uncharacterized protein YukE